MKALVLCGGLPQINLLQNLKNRGITSVLVDRNPDCMARPYADIFYPISTLDVDGIEKVAIDEKVDFLISVCADQVLLVVAEISERLSLPCYIDFETSKKVSNKQIMKGVFKENQVPTTDYVTMTEFDEDKLAHLKYPLIVKPVDAYSSRGVKKVSTPAELKAAFDNAKQISRTHNVIVEEFFEGTELSVDIYVENGEPHILCVSRLDKIPGNNKFVIHRAVFPAKITEEVLQKIKDAAKNIAKGFGLKDTPMLVQMLTNGKDVSVIEFCARTGGGIKFQKIKHATGFDVVDAVVELTLGNKPKVTINNRNEYIIDQFMYCYEGTFDHMERLDELLGDGVIDKFAVLKPKGHVFGEVESSGDRVAHLMISDKNLSSAVERLGVANSKTKAISNDGKDIMMHSLFEISDL